MFKYSKEAISLDKIKGCLVKGMIDCAFNHDYVMLDINIVNENIIRYYKSK